MNALRMKAKVMVRDDEEGDGEEDDEEAEGAVYCESESVSEGGEDTYGNIAFQGDVDEGGVMDCERDSDGKSLSYDESD